MEGDCVTVPRTKKRLQQNGWTRRTGGDAGAVVRVFHASGNAKDTTIVLNAEVPPELSGSSPFFNSDSR
jgi:hypothetical protein